MRETLSKPNALHMAAQDLAVISMQDSSVCVEELSVLVSELARIIIERERRNMGKATAVVDWDAWYNWLVQQETKAKMDFGEADLDTAFDSWWEIVGSTCLPSKEEAAVAFAAGCATVK